MTVSNDSPQAVPTGADPAAKTPALLSQEVRERVAVERQEIDRTLINSNLPIALREGLPPALAKQIVEFNGRAAAFTARQDALAEARVNLPLKMADPKLCGADLGERAVEVRAERYDILRLHVKLVAGRRPLLDALIKLIDKDCRAAESRVQDATARVAKALREAGYVAHPARGGRKGLYPLAEERAFDYTVRTQPPVQAAEAVVKTLRAELAELRRQADGVGEDVAYLEDRAADLWRQLVGAGT